MIVKNLNNTSTNKCKCDSWLDHWKEFSGKSVPTTCPVIDCSNKSEVGGHVQKDSKSDNSWYIIPLCKEDNNKRGECLTVSNSVALVSANISKTCGKK